jgi:hypothetical protein
VSKQTQGISLSTFLLFQNECRVPLDIPEPLASTLKGTEVWVVAKANLNIKG